MKNRIRELFSRKRNDILSVYFTAGFPRRESTVPVAGYLEAAGVDLIEIGIPFSDPVADGPVIQESNKAALDQGMTVKLLLDQVVEIRKTVSIPILLMGYVNPVLQYGIGKFITDAAAAGVDGFILPDLPIDEYRQQFQELVEAAGLTNIFLISPTTSEARIRHIDEATDAFIYAVSASSTTGARRDFTPDQIGYFERLQTMHLKNPILVGFGISNHAAFDTACRYAAGAIVGSAFVTLLKESDDLQTDIGNFVKSLRG
jgi:tryptophan synthase alpha chain